jgi:hypothetical protein
MYDTEIKILDLFNYKAERLKKSSFKVSFIDEVPEIKISSGTLKEQGFPNEDSLDACILTIRLFIQDNEPISIRNIQKLYDTLPISQDRKSRFSQARDKLNTFLDRPSLFERTIIILIGNQGKLNPTNREILNAFVYGEYSHLTRREKYKELTGNPLEFSFTKMEFIHILRTMIEIIIEIDQLNQEVISVLQNKI